MKKSTVIDLIRCHVQGNDPGFRQAAREVLDDFGRSGDDVLARYVAGLLANGRIEPSPDEPETPLPEAFFRRLAPSDADLVLPAPIIDDIQGLTQAVARKRGLHRFLLQGASGTGKTESVRLLGRRLQREVFLVDFTAVIDCRLGQSQKSLAEVFDALRRLQHPERILVFFDELDALVMDRVNAQDLREMGRLTSAMMKHLDALSPEVLLMAATNLHRKLDPALRRRFDAVISFDRYGPDDILPAADRILEEALSDFGIKTRNKRLFHKILGLLPRLLMPGELKPLIRRAAAFSDETVPLDYLRRLLAAVTEGKRFSEAELKAAGFTSREIESLIGSPARSGSPAAEER